MRFRVMASARRDLNEIFVYWAERAGSDVSDRLVDRIADQFWLLGEFPLAGKAATGIAPGVRIFPAGDYLIYYRKSRLTVDILHLFHGARNQHRAFTSAKKRI